MVLYGQIVIGPPGSGKTTYCDGMQQYLRLLGRDAWVVNLDPANEVPRLLNISNILRSSNDNDENKYTNEERTLPYDSILDVCDDVICLSKVITEFSLGPNGSLLFCMDYITHHAYEIISLLITRVDQRISLKFPKSDPKTIREQSSTTGATLPYLIFDLPGQIELYTHCTCLSTLISHFQNQLDIRFTMVHLVDVHSCLEADKFLSCALLSTTAMLRLELPAVNVLSKADLLGSYTSVWDGPKCIPFNLDYFMECNQLSRLIDYLNKDSNSSKRGKQLQKINTLLCEVVEDFGLVQYFPLTILDANSVAKVVVQIDKANGYIFAQNLEQLDSKMNIRLKTSDMMQCSIQTEGLGGLGGIRWSMSDIHEKFTGSLFSENIIDLEVCDNDNLLKKTFES